MASNTNNGTRPPKRETLAAGPFVLRPLLHQVPLAADGSDDDSRINCVEYLDGNLYVGTSASELLHFFRIPPDPSDPTGAPTFILASRLPPAFSGAAIAAKGPRPGVQQILLLPRVAKACVLCNWTVTFYSLPELSPVFGTTQVKNCNWIGGVDLNEGLEGPEPEGVTILMSLNKRIQVVRLGDNARLVKKIDFAGSLLSVRRDNIVCVADAKSYALLDVNRQLKIPLMSISSLYDSQAGGPMGQPQVIAPRASNSGLLRSASSATTRPLLDVQGHTRSTSLGGLISTGMRRSERQPTPDVDDAVFQNPDAETPAAVVPSQSTETGGSRLQDSTEKPLPTLPSSTGQKASSVEPAGLKPGSSTAPLPSPSTTASPEITVSSARTGPVFLKPHLASPTSDEFLLVTGTGPSDPGIGMFVNLDGDPTRPPLEFSRYPLEIAVEGALPESSPCSSLEDGGYILASIAKESEDGGVRHGLEIQRFDVNVGADEADRFWLEAGPSATLPLGVRSLQHSEDMQFQEVAERLGQRRFSAFSQSAAEASLAPSLKSVDSRTASSMEQQSKEKQLFEPEEELLPDGWEATRLKEEEDFARKLAGTSSRVAVWAGQDIWWAVRNPLLLQLENKLQTASASLTCEKARRQIIDLLWSLRGRDAKRELEFMTFRYIRQKAGLILVASFLAQDSPQFSGADMKAMEEALMDGVLDPRVVLALLPALRNEIVENRRGTWIYGGVKAVIDMHMTTDDQSSKTPPPVGSMAPEVLQFLRRFLAAWRRNKGFGSIPDESETFQTVDAALLLVLLELDRQESSTGKGSVRNELNDMVDRGVACFERAADLLEDHHRLFVLSRLYQSRKMAADVLATWRRIMEGERDDGGELGDGERELRRYLSRISNTALVQEYGIWLATRNPKLGVEVFADEKAKAGRFDPAHVVALLRQEAPAAVKYYLEHLVFDKGHAAYVDELIAYYLDMVTDDLRSSEFARELVLSSYEAYRALRPPKPTYRQFLSDNAPSNNEVWHSRLRLLQLLGGGHDYDADAIADRIRNAIPCTDDLQPLLVPETIIIDGRQHRHEQALRLLVHRLGDYDTAVAYCLRGGSASLFSPDPHTATSAPRRDSLPPSREAQMHLFSVLLSEFLTLKDVSDRVEQTSALLERFGGWFDVLEVLERIPDGWSVDLIAGFLATALRSMVKERRELQVRRALSVGENLRVDWEKVKKLREKKPVVVTVEEGLDENSQNGTDNKRNGRIAEEVKGVT